MSAMNLKKAQAIARDLKSRLALRLPSGYLIQEAQDDHGVMLLISQDATPAAGEQVVAIRILPEVTDHKNVIGLPQDVYAPLRAQVIEEASTLAGVSLLTLENRCKIDLELARLGLKQERFLNANGTVPALSQFAAAGAVTGSNLVASLPFDLYWPLAGQ